MNILKCISENYECDERTYIDKEGDKIVSLSKTMLLAHNASGFHSSVVLVSLDKETIDLELIRTARGLIPLSFRCATDIVKTVEVPQYVKFTCTRSPIFVCIDKIRRENGLQRELPIGEINHSDINKYNYIELKHIWEPYLKSDVLGLAFVYARHAMEMQKLTKIRIKGSLTEASRGWNCFGLYNKDREFDTFSKKHVRDFIRKSIKVRRFCAFNR